MRPLLEAFVTEISPQLLHVALGWWVISVLKAQPHGPTTRTYVHTELLVEDALCLCECGFLRNMRRRYFSRLQCIELL
jgi:hypothetical protein